MELKPNSLSLRDHLISIIAEQLELPRDIVRAVIGFQGEDAAKNAHSLNQIEFSGFGKFVLSQNKLRNKIKAVEDKILRLPEGEEKERLIMYLVTLKNRQK